MKNLTKIFIMSMVGLLVSGGLYLFFISPALTGVLDLRNKVSQKKSELNTLDQQIVTYQNSKKDLAQALGKDLIAGSLLQRENLELVIEEIESAAAKTTSTESLKINETQINTKNDSAVITGKLGVDEIPYIISTKGSFDQMIYFLEYMEHLPHFTEMTRISLTTTGSQAAAGSLFVHSGDIVGTIDAVFFAQKK